MAEQEDNSQLTTVVYLGAVVPPGGDGATLADLGVILDQNGNRQGPQQNGFDAERRSGSREDRCRCQLITWGANETDQDIDPNIPQGEVAREYKEATVTTADPEPHGGRYTLRSNYDPTDPESPKAQPVPAHPWIIQACDRNGRPFSAGRSPIEFKLVQYGHIVEPDFDLDNWVKVLTMQNVLRTRTEEHPVPCEAVILFAFRATSSAKLNNPDDPDDNYWIRAKWPASANDDVATVCYIRVKVLKAPCSNNIELLPGLADRRGRTVPGYVNARRADIAQLGGCIERTTPSGRNSQRTFAPLPETLGLRIVFDGPNTEDMDFSLTAGTDVFDGSPLEFLPLDSAASESERDKGERKEGTFEKPLGKGKGKWFDKFDSVLEPCGSRPIRFLLRVTEDAKVRRSIASYFLSQIVGGGQANPLPVTIRITDRTFGPLDRPSDPVVVAIALTGGLRVDGHASGTTYSDGIMNALREIAGNTVRSGSDPWDFDWPDGVAPKGGESKWILPTRTFCEGGNDGAHANGRQLLRNIMCGGCCVTITERSLEHYTPYYIDDAFPADARPAGTPPKSWENIHGIGPTIEQNEVVGTGRGTGGWISIDDGLVTSASKSKGLIEVWDRGNGVWVRNGRKVPFSAPRFIAHELGHAIEACRGNLRIAMKVPDGPDLLDFSGNIGGLDWTAKRAWFQDQGEYDAVVEYENPIALELGEDPRFNKPGS